MLRLRDLSWGNSNLFTNEAPVFTAEVIAIKEAIPDALKINPSEIDVYPNSRAVLDAFNSVVPQHSVVAEIMNMVKHGSIKIFPHWIKSYVGHPTMNGQMRW